MLKRAYIGTFHHISPKHLHRYANEFATRENVGHNTMRNIARIIHGAIRAAAHLRESHIMTPRVTNPYYGQFENIVEALVKEQPREPDPVPSGAATALPVSLRAVVIGTSSLYSSGNPCSRSIHPTLKGTQPPM